MALDRWEGGGRYTGLASPTSGIAARRRPVLCAPLLGSQSQRRWQQQQEDDAPPSVCIVRTTDKWVGEYDTGRPNNAPDEEQTGNRGRV